MAPPAPQAACGRVFGTGFHRTGTTSLDDALNMLGIRSIHGAFELFDNPRAPILDQYDAFTDNPIPILYKELDARFPGSRFIHTERPPEHWLRSVHWLFTTGRIKYEWHLEPIVERIHTAIYGIAHFDESVFVDRYKQHNRDIRRYFEKRPGDLLILDFSRGDGWTELCGFLSLHAPAAPFPKSNRATL